MISSLFGLVGVVGVGWQNKKRYISRGSSIWNGEWVTQKAQTKITVIDGKMDWLETRSGSLEPRSGYE